MNWLDNERVIPELITAFREGSIYLTPVDQARIAAVELPPKLGAFIAVIILRTAVSDAAAFQALCSKLIQNGCCSLNMYGVGADWAHHVADLARDEVGPKPETDENIIITTGDEDVEIGPDIIFEALDMATRAPDYFEVPISWIFFWIGDQEGLPGFRSLLEMPEGAIQMALSE